MTWYQSRQGFERNLSGVQVSMPIQTSDSHLVWHLSGKTGSKNPFMNIHKGIFVLRLFNQEKCGQIENTICKSIGNKRQSRRSPFYVQRCKYMSKRYEQCKDH